MAPFTHIKKFPCKSVPIRAIRVKKNPCQSQHKSPCKSPPGFTLIEVVLVILLVSLVLVAVFETIDRVRANESKLEHYTESEKEVYIFRHRLSGLFKTASSYPVPNNRGSFACFRGGKESVVFLTHSPLLSPFPAVHHVEIRYDRKARAVMYREAPYVWKEEPVWDDYRVLLEDVEAMQFTYLVMERRTRELSWKKETDSFESQPMPGQIHLALTIRGEAMEMVFHRLIKDRYEHIPPTLLKGNETLR